jgi:MFS family permease
MLFFIDFNWKAHLGYAATTAGLVITIYGFGALIFAPISGRLSDRFGPFRLMQYSLLLLFSLSVLS